MTGLGNRRCLDQQLRAGLEHWSRDREPFGLLFADIDHFNAINDRHGHQVGDEVLRVVAATLLHAVRATDSVARAGGEGFVVVLPHADAAAVRGTAEQLRALVAQSSLVVDRRRVTATVSIGGTLIRPRDTAASLLHRADALLYAAKHAGRNRVHLDVAGSAAAPEAAASLGPSHAQRRTAHATDNSLTPVVPPWSQRQPGASTSDRVSVHRAIHVLAQYARRRRQCRLRSPCSAPSEIPFTSKGQRIRMASTPGQVKIPTCSRSRHTSFRSATPAG